MIIIGAVGRIDFPADLPIDVDFSCGLPFVAGYEMMRVLIREDYMVEGFQFPGSCLIASYGFPKNASARLR